MQDTIKTFPVEHCMVCKGPGKNLYHGLDDRNFGKTKGWNISRCENASCDLLWLNPMPTKEDIGKAYQSYYTHSGQKKSLLDFLFLEKPYLSLKYGYDFNLSLLKKIIGYVVYLMPVVRNKFDFNILFLPQVKGGRILDFGCGNGWTLDNLKAGGWECHGLDFDSKAVQYCQSKGLHVQLGDIPSQNYPDEYFDAITINHVIEHVHEVDELLKNCYMKLKKGGRLVIATPNTENWQHSFYKSFWFQLDPPRHLHLFSISNLETVVKRNHFNILNSFSSFRMDAWSTIVSRGIKRKGRFVIGQDKKTLLDLGIGVFHQQISWLLSFFTKKAGGEIILIATKK